MLNLFVSDPDEAFSLAELGPRSGWGGLTWEVLHRGLGGVFVPGADSDDYRFEADGEIIDLWIPDIEEGLDTLRSFSSDSYGLWVWLGHLVEQTLQDPHNPLVRLYSIAWLAAAVENLADLDDVAVLDQWAYNVRLLESRGIWWPRYATR